MYFILYRELCPSFCLFNHDSFKAMSKTFMFVIFSPPRSVKFSIISFLNLGGFRFHMNPLNMFSNSSKICWLGDGRDNRICAIFDIKRLNYSDFPVRGKVMRTQYVN